MRKLRKKCGNSRKNDDNIISAYSAISAYFRIKENRLRKNAETLGRMMTIKISAYSAISVYFRIKKRENLSAPPLNTLKSSLPYSTGMSVLTFLEPQRA